MTNDDIKKDNELQYSEVESSVNVVGVSKSKKIIILAIIALAGGLIYYSYSGPDKVKNDKEQEQDINKLIEESKQVAQEVSPPIAMPNQLPELPPIVAPTTIPTPPMLERPKAPEPPKEFIEQIPAPPKSTVAPNVPIAPQLSLGANSYSRERRGTQMLVISGSNSSSSNNETGSDNQNRSVSLRTMQKTTAGQSAATGMDVLNFMIAQGKIIDAVLETSINTDLKGMLRAIISRDVYAEAGDIVLIPKGSRLIGQYSFDNKMRIDITWNRIMLPHGVDVAVNSPGIDELGRQGLSGIVDNKIYNALTSTMLLAGVSFGAAFAVSEMKDANQIVTITTDPDNGKQKTTTSLLSQTLSQAINDVSTSIKDIIKRYADTTPTVYVDQGTLVKIFVNQDILFPPEAIKREELIR